MVETRHMGDSEMTRKYLFVIYTVLTLLLYTSPGNTAELVHSVDNAYYSITQTSPPQLQVVAQGHVASGGWGFPQLIPYVNQKPPAHGILEFDFVARPPGANRLVIEATTPISANNLLHDYYPAIKGIKINARTNSTTLKIIPPPAAGGWSTGGKMRTR